MKPRAACFFYHVLGFFFCYKASSKLMVSKSVVGGLWGVAVFGRGAGVVAILLPLAELLIALLLIFERTRLYGLWASLFLLVLFTGYLGYMILLMPHLPCSCGGVIGSMSWSVHLVFNGVLIGLTVVGIRRSVVRNYE
jgi:hypothetical protein